MQYRAPLNISEWPIWKVCTSFKNFISKQSFFLLTYSREKGLFQTRRNLLWIHQTSATTDRYHLSHFFLKFFKKLFKTNCLTSSRRTTSKIPSNLASKMTYSCHWNYMLHDQLDQPSQANLSSSFPTVMRIRLNPCEDNDTALMKPQTWHKLTKSAGNRGETLNRQNIY